MFALLEYNDVTNRFFILFLFMNNEYLLQYGIDDTKVWQLLYVFQMHFIIY